MNGWWYSWLLLPLLEVGKDLGLIAIGAVSLISIGCLLGWFFGKVAGME